MKLFKTLLLVSLLSISSCKVHQVQETKPSNLVKLTQYGLNANVSIATTKGILSKPILKHGELITLNFNQLEGFAKKNNTYYPNLDITLVSKQKDTVYHNDNILGLDKDVKGITEDSLKIPLFPNYPLLIRYNISSGNEYTLYGTLRDTKSEKKLLIKMDFKLIQNNNPHLIVNKKGLDYSDIFITTESSPTLMLEDNKIVNSKYLMLYIKNLEGYTVKNNKASFYLKNTITNKLGEILIDDDKQMVSGCKDGKLIEQMISIPIELFEIKNYSKPLIYNLNISDKNSDTKLIISIE